MPDVKWVGAHIEVPPIRRPKKLTGTRFAAVLGLNPWSTPFETWCAITRTYEKPFTDTIYTAAGKIIEPKQAQYMKENYGFDNLTSPTDVWGEDYFKKTYGDFFPEYSVFGGMWDYLDRDDKKAPTAVFEMKTTKRAEDWQNDIPEYYALQAALYAYLLNVDQVYMVCSILHDEDYEHPEEFRPSVENTIVRPFKVSERYPHMDKMLDMAREWWAAYVKSGISPDFNERKDAEILKALRTANAPEETEDIKELLSRADGLMKALEAIQTEAEPIEKELKTIKDKIKDHLMSTMRDGDKYASCNSNQYLWKLTRSDSAKVDEKRLKADGIYEKYLTTSTTYRITVAQNKED